MRLMDCTMRPGKVVDVVDVRGTIKVSSPGLFSIDDSPELLPPVYPLGQINNGQFSSPLVDDNVWVINNNENTQQFYYIKYQTIPTDIQMMLDEKDANVEVLFSRDGKSGTAHIFFSDGTGIMIQNGNAQIQITPDGRITLQADAANRTIEINGDGISLGSPGKSSSPAVLGDKLVDTLNSIYFILNNINDLVPKSPYTAHLKAAFLSLPDLEDGIEKITSSNVTLD